MKIVIATRNPGKLAELSALLAGCGCQAIGLDEVEICGSPRETGSTFQENALIKAHFYATRANLPCIADDSGLCVDALNGKPGVFSARYAGEQATDAENNRKLLADMTNKEDRRAHFTCVTVCAKPDGRYIFAEGRCDGLILRETRGDGGFGYDPVFFCPEHNATFAEMPAELKNRISHRARSLALLKQALPSFLEGDESSK